MDEKALKKNVSTFQGQLGKHCPLKRVPERYYYVVDFCYVIFMLFRVLLCIRNEVTKKTESLRYVMENYLNIGKKRDLFSRYICSREPVLN